MEIFTSTDDNGFYTFETRTANLTFYPKKSGYTFTPKKATILNGNTVYNFEATLAENLTGVLKLSQILITPTSITSLSDNNYSYWENSTNNLKISEFVLKFNSEEQIRIIGTQYLPKNEFTNILGNDNFVIEITDGITNFEFEFGLKTYFTYNSGQNESISIEPFKYLKITSTLDSGDLNENNQIKFIASGLNSTHSGFTYDIQFVFNYAK